MAGKKLLKMEEQKSYLGLGAAIHAFITILISFTLYMKDYSLWLIILVITINALCAIQGFKKLEKDHVYSMVNILGNPDGNAKGGQVIWLIFGWRRINKKYSTQKDRVSDQLVDALSKDNKLVSAKFNLLYRIKNPILLEATAGDNYEKDLSELRKNAFEEFIRGVELTNLETSGQDNLSRKEGKIRALYSSMGLEVVGQIEVHDIKAKLETVREEVQQAHYRAETKKVNQKAEELAINQKIITLLLDKSKKSTYKKTEATAKKNLEDEFGKNYNQFDIADTMILILKQESGVSDKVMRAIRFNATNQYNLEQGNVTSYQGLNGGGVKPFMNIKENQRKNSKKKRN